LCGFHELGERGKDSIMAMCKFAVRHLGLWGFGLTILLGVAPSARSGPLTVVIQPVIAGSATVTSSFLSNQEQYATTIFDQIDLTMDFLAAISDSSVPTSYDGTNANEPQLYFDSSSSQSPPILTVWFVDTITYFGNNDRGLSQAYGTKLGSWIATTGSAAAVNDTLAHEIGNDLDDLQPELTNAPTNLMEVGTNRQIPSSLSQVFPTGSDDQITSAQGTVMLTSNYVQSDLPEPGSFALGALGILLIAAARPFRAWRRFRN
jgi:hypothetical protein